MGLDITAYRNLTPAPDSIGLDEDGDPIDGYVRIYVNSDFPERADHLATGQIFKQSEDKADTFCFRAGGYSGYNSWREQLAEMAGYPEVEYKDQLMGMCKSHAAAAWDDSRDLSKPVPFAELINFSDCEGVIGPKTSAKLAKDFAAFQDKADQQDERFRRVYGNFRQAFEMAAQNGMVEFH